MPDAQLVEWIRDKFMDLAESLDELGRRRWAAIEARSLGRGGIAAVAEATGMSDRTIRTGIKELEMGDVLPSERQRREGAGRRSRRQEQPTLVNALENASPYTTLIVPIRAGSDSCKLSGRVALRGRSPSRCRLGSRRDF